MRITFRRVDNVQDMYHPIEEAVLFDSNVKENETLAKKQFEAIRSLLKEQQEARLVDIFDMNETYIHFTRTYLCLQGTYPNEDCYYNLESL